MGKHEDEAVDCPAGVDPLVWRRQNYTCGLRNTALTGMVLVSLLFVTLAAVLLQRCSPAPAPVSTPTPTPAPTPEAETTTTTLQPVVSVVWTVSLLVCSYLCFWIHTFSHTMGAATIFFRVSYVLTLAYAAAGLAGPLAGMAAAHLATAWAAGLLGYALASHRMRTGIERAADEAAARTLRSGQSEDEDEEEVALVYCVFVSGLVTLFMAARVVWLVFFPSYGEERAHFIVLELSWLVLGILYFWAVVVLRFWLHEALVSLDFMMRVFWYCLALAFPSLPCVLVSEMLWVYYFGLQMMAMAAFFGYILAINARRNEILARYQPILKDLEQG